MMLGKNSRLMLWVSVQAQFLRLYHDIEKLCHDIAAYVCRLVLLWLLVLCRDSVCDFFLHYVATYFENVATELH